ncbi:MAG: DUF99 family protein [Thermoplasmata archaeon]|nr:DUF99 family protein [Thermoplasmata archaeon]
MFDVLSPRVGSVASRRGASRSRRTGASVPTSRARGTRSKALRLEKGTHALARALGKPHLRVIALDDGAFSRRQRRAPLVAVSMSLPDLVEGIELTWVSVDGTDATARATELLRGSPFLAGARAILVDGIAVAGFNLFDLKALSRDLHRPVISVTSRAPDLLRIRSALRTYFPAEFRRRWGLVRASRLFPVSVGGRPLWASVVGCRREEARALLLRSIGHGRWPEPLRLAHLVGHAVGTTARAPVRPNR